MGFYVTAHTAGTVGRRCQNNGRFRGTLRFAPATRCILLHPSAFCLRSLWRSRLILKNDHVRKRLVSPHRDTIKRA